MTDQPRKDAGDSFTAAAAAALAADRSKEYEILWKTRDADSAAVSDGLAVVEEFARSRGLILYGGQAIDYAMRAVGSKLYPDDLPPDYDMYSPNSVDDAYDLAEILYERGYTAARALAGLHMETMRVDVVRNHFIADISYRPAAALTVVPTMEYNGIKFVDPLFQRIDQHSSLSFPYDNSPSEVVFARWAKDVKRHNILAAAYPLEDPVACAFGRETTAADLPSGVVLAGYAAYAAMYDSFIELVGPDHEIVPRLAYGGWTRWRQGSANKITWTGPACLDIIHYDVVYAAKKLGLTSYKLYEPYVSMLPERLAAPNINIWSTKHRLLSVVSIAYGDRKIRLACAQFLLKTFLSQYFIDKTARPKYAAAAYARYWSLIAMINALADCGKLAGSPLDLSVEVYGRENMSLSMEVILANVYHNVRGDAQLSKPLTYSPAKYIAANKPRPTFDYESVEFFRELGREKKESSDNQ